MRKVLISLVAFFALTVGYANVNGSRASETPMETGNEKSENKKPQPQETPQNAGIEMLSSDSTATTVKFNYLFYMIYKLKYGQEPPAELIDSDI